MTNAEKYLKDGVVAKELWKTFQVYYYKNKSKESDVEKAFRNFFEQEARPTLTEDERVILRNIDTTMYTHIGREPKTSIFDLVLTGEKTRCVEIDDILKPDLFQFIKERRRI